MLVEGLLVLKQLEKDVLPDAIMVLLRGRVAHVMVEEVLRVPDAMVLQISGLIVVDVAEKVLYLLLINCKEQNY